jgi:hypothetical protein
MSDTVHYCSSPAETQSYAVCLSKGDDDDDDSTKPRAGGLVKGGAEAGDAKYHGTAPTTTTTSMSPTLSPSSRSSSPDRLSPSDYTGSTSSTQLKRRKVLVRHADSGGLLETGDEGWIFVLRDGVFYCNATRTPVGRYFSLSRPPPPQTS